MPNGRWNKPTGIFHVAVHGTWPGSVSVHFPEQRSRHGRQLIVWHLLQRSRLSSRPAAVATRFTRLHNVHTAVVITESVFFFLSFVYLFFISKTKLKSDRMKNPTPPTVRRGAPIVRKNSLVRIQRIAAVSLLKVQYRFIFVVSIFFL